MNKGINWYRIVTVEDLPPIDTVCVAKHKLDGNITCKATKTGFFGVNEVNYDYNEFLCYYIVNENVAVNEIVEKAYTNILGTSDYNRIKKLITSAGYINSSDLASEFPDIFNKLISISQLFSTDIRLNTLMGIEHIPILDVIKNVENTDAVKLYKPDDYIEKMRKQGMIPPSMYGREEENVNKGTEFTPDHIFNIVKKLIGRISPSGCSNADIKHLENLKVFIEVADKINEHITYCANFKDSHEFSVKQIGSLAEKYRERINVDI